MNGNRTLQINDDISDNQVSQFVSLVGRSLGEPDPGFTCRTLMNEMRI